MHPRVFVIIIAMIQFHLSFAQIDGLNKSIEGILKNKKAVVGVSVRGIEDGDSLSVNGDKMIAMFSVIKFYVALAVLDQADKGKLSLDKKILVKKTDLDPNTFSPLRDERSNYDFEITVAELLKYAVCKSDNIAFEKLTEEIGGIETVNKFIQKTGIKNVSIISTYKAGYDLVLKNKTSANAAVELMVKSYKYQLLSKKSTDFLWNTMSKTTTGPDRIKGLLPKGTMVAHKTGTSGINEKGESLGFNDIGIVTLPSGKHVAIAVLITNSFESEAENARIIAEISKASYDYFVSKENK